MGGGEGVVSKGGGIRGKGELTPLWTGSNFTYFGRGADSAPPPLLNTFRGHFWGQMNW